MRNIKIGLAAAMFKNNDMEFNLKKVVSFMNNAKNNNTGLLLFGECFLQGFGALSWDNPEIDLSIGVERKSEPINLLREHCKKINISLGIGYIEKEENTLYSSYLIIDNNGNDLVNYRRISEGWKDNFSEDSIYKQGSSFDTFDYCGYKMTVGLCGDFWTDNVIKLLPRNMDIVLWPVFVDYSKKEWTETAFSEYILQAKTIWKNIFFINSICEEEKTSANGGAFVIIDNEIKCSLDMGKEEILYYEYWK